MCDEAGETVWFEKPPSELLEQYLSMYENKLKKIIIMIHINYISKSIFRYLAIITVMKTER